MALSNAERQRRYIARLKSGAYHRMHYELDTAAQGRMRFLDIMMPNGKKLGDCTGAEVREIAEELERFSKEIKAAFKLA